MHQPSLYINPSPNVTMHKPCPALNRREFICIPIPWGLELHLAAASLVTPVGARRAPRGAGPPPSSVVWGFFWGGVGRHLCALGIVSGLWGWRGGSPATLATALGVPSAAVPCRACREEQTAAGAPSENTAPAG